MATVREVRAAHPGGDRRRPPGRSRAGEETGRLGCARVGAGTSTGRVAVVIAENAARPTASTVVPLGCSVRGVRRPHRHGRRYTRRGRAARLAVAGADVVAVDRYPLRAAPRRADGRPIVLAASYTSFYETAKAARSTSSRASFDDRSGRQTTPPAPRTMRGRASLGIRRWRSGCCFPNCSAPTAMVATRSCWLRASSGAASPGVVEVAPDEPIPASLDCYLLGGGEDHARSWRSTGSSDHRCANVWAARGGGFGVCGPAASRHSPRARRRVARGLGFFDASTHPARHAASARW